MTRTFSLLFVLCPLLTAFADNWPMWRGPNGDGTTTESNLPEKWSPSENVVWKVALPDRGNSTPVVWGDRVFVTQAIEKEGKRLLLCFDKKTGKPLWDAGTIYRQPELTHATNPHCAASPATDGERVIVFFASAGMFCYDMDGNELWKRTDLGQQKHVWGNGASPVIAGDRVFLNFGPGANTMMYGFDRKTGETLWEHKEPGGDSGESGNKNWLGSWCDPLFRTTGGRDELLMAYPGRACAFDPATGQELWTCGGLTKLVYNSPLYADGVMYAMCGYGGAALAVKVGGSGDVTKTNRVWYLPKVSQRIGSGVIHDGHHYILTDGGIVECRDLKTGDLVFQERLKGNNWSSLVLSWDGKCYAANQTGACYVFKASPTFELIATNSLGEKIIGSVAVSEGRLFIRGYNHLWCIGNK